MVRWNRSMLLCSSSRPGDRFECRFLCGWSGQVGVDLSSDVALQTADDLSFAQALGGAPLDVVAGRLVMAHPHDGGDVERAVSRPVASPAESVAAGGSSAARWLWCDAAELGEGGLVADAVGVVAGGDEELAGELDPDAVQLDECRCGSAHQDFDLPVQRLDLLVEDLPSACQVAQR